MASLTYPSGNRLNFGYDAAGRISAVTLNPTHPAGVGTDTGRTITLLTAIEYEPFGAPSSWRWGNGAAYIRSFDTDGRLTHYPLGDPSQGGVVRALGWDAASRVTSYTHVNNLKSPQPLLNQNFVYDDLNRLTGWSAASSSQTYQYDLSGNRTRLSIGVSSYPYTIAATSNRLTATAGPPASQVLTYDAAGNLVDQGSTRFTYSDRGRMSRATIGTNELIYLYNGRGERVSKQGPITVVPGGTTLYSYNEAGQLIGEYDASASPRVRQETIYLGDTPVAVLRQSISGSPPVVDTAVHYIYADHLNTPRVIAQASDNRMRWRWDHADPFGMMPPDQNPSGLGSFVYHPRLPGQIYDPETNLHYNYFRNYDPLIGRYIQSDPVGLAGGINTYAYVGGNPLSYVDPNGLNPLAGAYGGAGVGSAFGPVGTVVGGLVGAGVGAWLGWNVVGPMFAKPPADAHDPNGPKAPGRPGDAEGYCGPKGGDDWVRNPNGRGNGWRDKNGNVWVPTGPGGEAHGGPHWDVQTPGGGYVNVYPGGARRP
jgi:RHS repeat-associated protein